MSLALLRKHPITAIQNYAYYFDPQVNLDFGSTDIGIPVCLRETGISQSNLHDDIKACYTIEAGNIGAIEPDDKSGDPDFYFPYDHHEGFIGHVAVSETCEIGTIVFTSGMNGCALDVRYDANNNRFLFYHDKNGKNAHLIPSGAGITQICRIEGDDYWNDDKMISLSDETHSPMVQFICVKCDTRDWALLASGILLTGTKVTGAFRPLHPSNPHKACFRGFFGARLPLFEH